MYLKILLLIGTLSLISACTSDRPLTDSSQQTPQNRYQQLLAELKASHRVDYDALRMAYTETTDYNPVFGNDSQLTSSAFQLLDEGKPVEAIKRVKQVLEHNYVSLSAHYAALLAYRMLDNEAQEYFHREIVNGIMDAIEHNGNGQSPATAFVAISADEAFTYLSLNALEIVSKDRITESDSIYYLYTVKPQNSEKHHQLYFNVDILEQRSAARVSDYIKSQGYIPARREP